MKCRVFSISACLSTRLCIKVNMLCDLQIPSSLELQRLQSFNECRVVNCDPKVSYSRLFLKYARTAPNGPGFRRFWRPKPPKTRSVWSRPWVDLVLGGLGFHFPGIQSPHENGRCFWWFRAPKPSKANVHVHFSLRHPLRIRSLYENGRCFWWFGTPKPSKTTSISPSPRA